MPIVGIDHVQVAAPPGCESDARRFYGGLLGLEELEKPAPLAGRGGVWFALGDAGQQLHVGVEQDFAPARKAHPALVVSLGGPELLAERLLEAGGGGGGGGAPPRAARGLPRGPGGGRRGRGGGSV